MTFGISPVRSDNMGLYLLPLKDTTSPVYPVASEVRVLLDGKMLGKPIQIECKGVNGLYLDDVYDVVIQQHAHLSCGKCGRNCAATDR